jgi:hypothetical protein
MTKKAQAKHGQGGQVQADQVQAEQLRQKDNEGVLGQNRYPNQKKQKKRKSRKERDSARIKSNLEEEEKTFPGYSTEGGWLLKN